MGLSADDEQFLAGERAVAAHSAELKKELRLLDLVGIQVLTIVAFTWLGVAGKLGAGHVMFWIPAMLLFYVPSGIVVAYLSKEMPLEGGIYQWVKLRFGPMPGFLTAMNLWLYNVLQSSTIGLQIAALAPYALGPGARWITTNKGANLGLGVAILCGLMLVGWRGLAIGKWVSNAGGVLLLMLFAVLVAVALPLWIGGGAVGPPAALTMPAISLLSLNLLAKMGFGAFCGADAVAVFSGECRGGDAARTIRRSVWISAPIIATIFIVGTAGVLTFSRPESIDVLLPQIQALSLGAPGLAGPGALVYGLYLLAGGSLFFSVLIRFPMVAGWDHLLPEWFSRLDPKFKTPRGSVLFAGAVAIAFSVLANLGAGNQEAYQFLVSAALVCYAGAYLAMFAIPLWALGEQAPVRVRVAAASGFPMTLMFVVLSVFPIVEEQNPGWFTLKMVGVVGTVQLAGAAYYRRAAGVVKAITQKEEVAEPK